MDNSYDFRPHLSPQSPAPPHHPLPSPKKSHFSKLPKKIVLIIAIVTLLALALGAWFIKRSLDSRQATSTNQVKVVYPNSWHEASLSDIEVKNAGLILKLERSDPSARIIIRRIVGQLESNFKIDTLPEQLAKSLQKKGVTITKKEVRKLDSLDTAQIRYTQTDSKDHLSYETVQIIIPTSKQTFYFTARTKLDDFPRIGGDINSIANSFARYVKANQ